MWSCFECPWSNLQLLLSLQEVRLRSLKKSIHNKHIHPKKQHNSNAGRRFNLHMIMSSTELVKCKVTKRLLGFHRLVVFVNNWIQSLLISSAYRIIVHDFCLDYRCWEIFRFCLNESINHKVSLNFKKDLLQVIQCIATTCTVLPLLLGYSFSNSCIGFLQYCPLSAFLVLSSPMAGFLIKI